MKILAILCCCGFASCVDMPVSVGIGSDYGGATYSKRDGIGLHVEVGALSRKSRGPSSIHPEK